MIYHTEDILLHNNEKNIYCCLVNPEKDFKDKNFTMRTPAIEILNREKIINPIKKKYGSFDKGFLHLIRELEAYVGINYKLAYKAKYRYLQSFKKNKLNIVLLRVISLCLSDNQEESIKLFN